MGTSTGGNSHGNKFDFFHKSTSLDINKTNGMLSSNARRIFCDNVTCFGTNKCCSNRSHLQESFNCSSHLACKAPRVQLSICFPISLSRIHLTASLYLRPANCFKDNLLEKPRNSHWNKLDFFHKSTSLDINNVNKTNGMLSSNARRIFCNNVTCFGTNKCCSNRSHLQECFKCSSLLACKAPNLQLSTCFPISLSRIHLTASLYMCPADCSQEIMFEQARTSHPNNLGFFGHIKTDYSGRTKFFDRKVGINISDRCTRESKNKFGSKCDAFGADNYEQ